MATYANNILPTDAAYYTLTNATITNGVLHINAGGSAVINVDTSMLGALTETMRVSAVIEPFTDEYKPGAYIKIRTTLDNGEKSCHLCAITRPAAGTYNAIINFPGAEYEDMQIEIFAENETLFTLWEVCPELSEDISVIIDGVEQSLPRLLYDYNTWPLVVQQRERAIGLITCDLLKNTDLQGHLQLSYTASVATTLTLRFKDSDATELFAPLVYDLNAGRGNIGVPHSYINRLAGYHNFVVTAQVTNGTFTIGTRGLLFTIDGGYLASRTSDVGSYINDITVEQKDTDESPSFVWVISVEAGEAVVRKRAFTPKVLGEAFVPVYSIARAKEAAIEFDGEWVLSGMYSEKPHRFNTRENPMCFFIDNLDRLYAQVGDDGSTRELLTNDAVSISACRGYNSAIYRDQDQGLICLYRVLNGYDYSTDNEGVIIQTPIYKAYYRQYKYNSTTGKYTWELPIEVNDGFDQVDVTRTILHAQVHRLNDYRVGFAITSASIKSGALVDKRNYWLITDRTYVGMASRPEALEFALNKNFNAIQLLPIDMAGYEQLTVKGTLSEDRHTIIATFNHPIRCMSDNMLRWMIFPAYLTAGETIYDDAGHIISIGSIEKVELEGNELRVTVSEYIKTAYTITLENTNIWQYYTGTSEEADDGVWVGMHKQMSWTYDPYAYIEASATDADSPDLISLDLTSATYSILQKPLVTDNKSVNETVEVIPTRLNASFLFAKPEESYHDHKESVDITLKRISTTFLQLHVGNEPI